MKTAMTLMAIKVLCFLGIHSWEYRQQTFVTKKTSGNKGPDVTVTLRECEHCHHMQRFCRLVDRMGWRTMGRKHWK